MCVGREGGAEENKNCSQHIQTKNYFVDIKNSYKSIKKYVKSNEIEKFYNDFILKAQYILQF